MKENLSATKYKFAKTFLRPDEKHKFSNCEKVVWIYHFAFQQSFFDHSKSPRLQKKYQPSLCDISVSGLEIGKKKHRNLVNKCWHPSHNSKIGYFMEWKGKKTTAKSKKRIRKWMNNTCAKMGTSLWHSYHGCWSLLKMTITILRSLIILNLQGHNSMR